MMICQILIAELQKEKGRIAQRTFLRFKDLFPLSLTGLSYNQQETDVNYLTATVTFDYLNYEFATPNSSTTTVTTS